MDFIALLKTLEESGKYYLNLGAFGRFGFLHQHFVYRVKRMREFREDQEDQEPKLEDSIYLYTVFLVKLEQLKRKFK